MMILCWISDLWIMVGKYDSIQWLSNEFPVSCDAPFYQTAVKNVGFFSGLKSRRSVFRESTLDSRDAVDRC